MNPYIGDRPLDPPEDDECEICGGRRFVVDSKPWVCPDEWEDVECPACNRYEDPSEPDDYPED